MDQRGQSIVEVILAIAVLAIGASSIVILIMSSFRGGLSGGRQTEAIAYVREGWEAATSIGDTAYNKLRNGTWGLSDSTNRWELSGASDTYGDFTRTVTVADVNRDGSGDIVTSGGTRDIHTKKVTTVVTWMSQTVSRTLTFVNYIMNWASRNIFHDLSADFSSGTHLNTQIFTDVDSDGAVGLLQSAPAFWACASIVGAYDKPGSQDANDVYKSGSTAYYVTNNEPAGGEFYVVDVSTPSAPTVTGSLEIGADVRSVWVSGSFAYIATTANAAEFQVVSLAIPAVPVVVGTLNLSGNGDANDLVVSGTRAYLSRDNDAGGSEFFIIDISTSILPTLVGSSDLGDTSLGVQISGSYAYAVTNSTTAEFKVIDMTIEATPTVVATLDFAGNATGNELAISGTKAYVVTGNDGTSDEFYVVDISTPASASVQGSVDLGNGANVVVMDGTTAMVGTSTAGRTLQIVDAATPTAPVLAVTQNLSQFSYDGLFWDGTYLYAAAADSDLEFQILERNLTSGWDCPDLFSSIDLSGTREGRGVYVVGTALYGVVNSAAGADFFIYDVTDPTAPALTGSLNLGAGGMDVVVSGNYAYIASDDNSQELKVIDITTPSAPVQVGSLNLAGNTDATGINISGTKVLMAQGSNFFNINVSTPSAPASLGSVALGGTGYRIEVYNATYAFVATGNSAAEVQVIDYSPSTPTIAGSYNAPGSLVGRSLWLKGNQLYLTTQNNAGGSEFFILSVSSPTAPTLTGSLDLGADGLAVAADNDETFAFSGVDKNHQTAWVINATTPASPVRELIISTLNGFVRDAYFLNDTLYLGTTQNDGELAIYKKITGGGGGGGGFQTSGTFASAAFDAGSTTNWDTIEWSEYITGCASGDIKLQIRTATTSGGLAGELWQGPEGEDGDSSDFFTDPLGELIDTTHNGDQYLQYLVTFTGDGTCTHELTDITISYTPY